MKTYLFVWNPKRWFWEDIEENITEIDLTGKCSQSWSCGTNKSIAPGSRIFLVKLGTEPKGIIGAGFATSMPYSAPHWSKEEGKLALYVNIDFEVLLNPELDPILDITNLMAGNLVSQTWLPQSSGISIKPEIVDDLEAIWFRFLTTQSIRHNPFVPTENEMQKAYTEGTPNQVIITKYERNPAARKECLGHYGFSCFVCDFNFEKTYGEIGREFIHIHHLEQISTKKATYNVNPIHDLRPVCPNCHAMIHKRMPAYSIEEMKEIIWQMKS